MFIVLQHASSVIVFRISSTTNRWCFITGDDDQKKGSITFNDPFLLDTISVTRNQDLTHPSGSLHLFHGKVA